VVDGGWGKWVVDGGRHFILSLGGLIMADTKISDFGDIPELDLVNDRIPILDVSGTGTAKNKLISPATLMASKLDLTGGTVTGQIVLAGASATGALNLAPTWNNAGTDFNLIYGRVTNTASGASSCLIDLGTVALGSVFSLGLDGKIRINSSVQFTNKPIYTIPGSDQHGLGSTSGGCGLYSNASMVLEVLSFNNGVTVSDNVKFGWRSGDILFQRIAAGVLALTNSGASGATLEFREQTAPSAPSTNNVRIYAEDNGSGKTRLMAVFATGAAQQIAIEP